MASEIKANKISPATGTDFTLGDSGDTFTILSGTTLDIASGATIDATGATVTGFGGAPYFDAGIDTTQTLTDSTWTKVVFDDEYYDSDSAFNPSTGVFTIPSGEGGTYLFYTDCSLYGSGAINTAMIYFYVNGGASGDYAQDQYFNSAAYITNVSKSRVIECSAGDEITVYAFISQYNSAGTAQLLNTRASFGGFRLST